MKDFKKTNSFKTPDGYLEGFTMRVMDKIEMGEKFGAKKEPFTVPDGYFEGLNQTIARKTIQKPTKVVQLNAYSKYLLVAASVAAIIVLVTLGIVGKGNIPAAMTFDDLASSEIEKYFEINDLDLSTYEIAEMIPVDHLEVSDLQENPFQEDAVIEYLNNNIEEFEDLNLDNNE
jgi:hypothetical protein